MSDMLNMVFPYLSPMMTMTQCDGTDDEDHTDSGVWHIALLLYKVFMKLVSVYFGILQDIH